MKSMLACLAVLGAATLVSAQDLSRPLPSVVHSALPASAPIGMSNHPTNWGAACGDSQSCATGSPSSARGGCGMRLWNWLTFRVCEPVHEARVPYPYHAPLRTYCPYTPAPLGADGPLDCNTSRGRICGRQSTGCATPATGMMIARPGYESGAGDFEASGERKSLVRRMMAALTTVESAPTNAAMSRSGNPSPLIRTASPSVVTPAAAMLPANAIRPFSNP